MAPRDPIQALLAQPAWITFAADMREFSQGTRARAQRNREEIAKFERLRERVSEPPAEGSL